MSIVEINAIGENAFYNFSLNDTIEVVTILERLNWIDIKDKNLEENNGFYTRLLDIVDDRIASGSFIELTDDAEAKSLLLLRILRVRTSVSQYRLMVLRDEVERKMLAANEQFANTQKKLTMLSSDTQAAIQEMSTATEKSINEHLQNSEEDFGKKIKTEIESAKNSLEPQLITTVLTLMGVFSAVITIIMSIVITSSAWLNNASNASAVVAFIVPNLVVVFAIVVLLLMVFSRKEADIVVIPENRWDYPDVAEKALKKSRIQRGVAIAMIAVFTIGILVFSALEISSNDEPHVRYVLSQGMYECKILPCEEGEEPITVIEFEINGMKYTLPYDERYFHDGKLYFCEDHQILE